MAHLWYPLTFWSFPINLWTYFLTRRILFSSVLLPGGLSEEVEMGALDKIRAPSGIWGVANALPLLGCLSGVCIAAV
jgi:hypothetical protein